MPSTNIVPYRKAPVGKDLRQRIVVIRWSSRPECSSCLLGSCSKTGRVPGRTEYDVGRRRWWWV